MTTKEEAIRLIKYFKKRKLTPEETIPIMRTIIEAYDRVLLKEILTV